MLQTVDGRTVFIVDFDAMPDLPITWNSDDEEPYARALHAAIESGQLTEPGKYAIEVDAPRAPLLNALLRYDIYTINE